MGSTSVTSGARQMHRQFSRGDLLQGGKRPLRVWEGIVKIDLKNSGRHT
jgi:hypothetical protein